MTSVTMKSATIRSVDIASVGAGPVGLALAGMLLARGVQAERIAIIDGKTAAAASQDPRSIALSWGSHELLKQIHAWPAMATAITQIHVSRRGNFGRTLIDCAEHQVPALGYVCRYGDVVSALSAALDTAGVFQHRPARVITAEENDTQIILTLSDDQQIHAGLLVQAEGGVFGTQTDKEIHRDYRQMAIVASVNSDGMLAGRAFERFTEEGPLALLPDRDAYSLVWCVRPENCEALLALPDTDFLQALQQAFGSRVGRFTQISPRHSYPLGLNAQPSNSPRSVAIGNAAQTLHPVAGQGLNLGLRDAAVLAKALANNPTMAGLRQFEQERRGDRGLTLKLTDLMARVFASSSDQSISQSLLGLSLGMIDLMPPARRALSKQMMFGWRG
jgi:2-octaprenyl-6-methoxyphenol hydroxylase